MNSRFLSKIHPIAIVLLATMLVWPASVQGYAVLSHEAIIDAA